MAIYSVIFFSDSLFRTKTNVLISTAPIAPCNTLATCMTDQSLHHRQQDHLHASILYSAYRGIDPTMHCQTLMYFVQECNYLCIFRVYTASPTCGICRAANGVLLCQLLVPYWFLLSTLHKVVSIRGRSTFRGIKRSCSLPCLEYHVVWFPL